MRFPTCHRKALALALTLTIPARPHDPITTKLTWTREISRLINAHCLICHRDGGSAMSLATYNDARPWAKAIRDEVLERRMPPWDAVKGVGDFQNDPSLSQPELDLFVSWVEGGAPEGNPADLPPQPSLTRLVVTRLLPAKPVRVARTLVIKKPAELLAIKPEGPLEVTSCAPDGTVSRLLWVRNFRPEWNRTYELRTPAPLPSGTKILVYSPTNSAARLFTKNAPAP